MNIFYRINIEKCPKTSFEKNCFSAWASDAEYGFDQQGWYGMFVACGIWCLADVWKSFSEKVKVTIKSSPGHYIAIAFYPLKFLS